MFLLEPIQYEEFQKLIKEAHMICSPKYGYMILIDKENPYKKTPFDFPKECRVFLKQFQKGKMLKLEEGSEVSLVAFILK